MSLSELVSAVTSLGVVAVADDLAPNLVKSASKTISKVCVEPFLEPIEKFLKKVCKLKECQSDMSQPREKRAEALAHTILIFSSSWAASMIAKWATRQMTIDAFKVYHPPEPRNGKWLHDKVLFRGKINRHDWKVFCWDEGVHLGSLLMINTATAKQTDSMINTASSVLQKTLGWSERKAKDVASMAMIWEIPNVLGLGAGIGAVGHTHYKHAKEDKARWLLGGGNSGLGHPAT